MKNQKLRQSAHLGAFASGNHASDFSPLDHLKHCSEDFQSADDIEEVYEILDKEINRLGFDLFAYQLMWPQEGPPQALYKNNFPSNWQEHFIKEKYITTDIVTQLCAQQVRPFLWEHITVEQKITLRQQMILDEAKDFGLKSGGTIPIHGPGSAKALLSVSCEMPSAEFDMLFQSRRIELWVLANCAHERFIEFGINNKDLPNIKLSPIEIEILQWTAKGKSTWEIAQILNVSDTHIKYHINKVCEKFKVKSRTHAATLASSARLIMP